MVGKILAQYGTAVTLRHGGAEQQIQAFLQPVRSSSWQYLDSSYSPLGEIPRGRYIYIGPVDPKAEAGDELWLEEKAYLLRRTELIRDGGGPVYCWGLCLEKGGEDNWGKQS